MLADIFGVSLWWCHAYLLQACGDHHGCCNGYIDTDSNAANAASIGVVESGSQIMSVVRVFEFSESNTNNIFSVPHQISWMISTVFDPWHDVWLYHHSEFSVYPRPSRSCARFDSVVSQTDRTLTWTDGRYSVGQNIVLEAYVALNPNTYTEIYNDRFWRSMSLPVQDNGAEPFYTRAFSCSVVLVERTQLYSEGNEEVNQIEEQMQDMYELPTDFFTGWLNNKPIYSTSTQ